MINPCSGVQDRREQRDAPARGHGRHRHARAHGCPRPERRRCFTTAVICSRRDRSRGDRDGAARADRGGVARSGSRRAWCRRLSWSSASRSWRRCSRGSTGSSRSTIAISVARTGPPTSPGAAFADLARRVDRDARVDAGVAEVGAAFADLARRVDRTGADKDFTTELGPGPRDPGVLVVAGAPARKAGGGVLAAYGPAGDLLVGYPRLDSVPSHCLAAYGPAGDLLVGALGRSGDAGHRALADLKGKLSFAPTEGALVEPRRQLRSKLASHAA